MSSQPSPTTTTTTRATNSSLLDRQLPHAFEAERAVLGSMLLDERAISEAITTLQDGGRPVFWNEKHQRLYEHIVALWRQSKPMDGVVIKDELVRIGQFESLGGYEFLGDLIGAVPSATRIREYARIVREKHLLRQLIDAAARIMEAAYENKRPAPEVLDFASKEIFGITERGVSGGAQLIPELVEEVFRKIEQLDGAVLTGEPSGYYELDELTCGFQPGELIIIAARPSMGKTALGLNIAEHMALDESRAALFFSLEMSRQQVAQRLLCSRARVDAQKLRRGRSSREDLSRLQRVADELRDKPLLIDDTSSLTILEMRARARLEARRHGVRAIFVDYLQLARAPGTESRQQEVAEVSRGLKALAKELSVPVIAMAQLNRNPEERSGNRPRMSDLRESGAIEQDADLIALLHRESYYNRSDGGDLGDEDNTAELIIAKQRNGPVGTVTLHFNRHWTRFDNLQASGRYEGAHERGGYADFPGP